MTQQNKDPKQVNEKTKPLHPNDIEKREQREKAEIKEVVGRHKNDGQLGHKGRQ